MMTTVDAERTARDCIRQATGFDGPILPSDVLKEVGVVDDDMRDAVNDEVVTNTDVGVLHYGHKLGPNDLTFTTESLVFELRDEIHEKAQVLRAPAAASGTKSKKAGRRTNTKNAHVAKLQKTKEIGGEKK